MESCSFSDLFRKFSFKAAPLRAMNRASDSDPTAATRRRAAPYAPLYGALERLASRWTRALRGMQHLQTLQRSLLCTPQPLSRSP